MNQPVVSAIELRVMVKFLLLHDFSGEIGFLVAVGSLPDAVDLNLHFGVVKAVDDELIAAAVATPAVHGSVEFDRESNGFLRLQNRFLFSEKHPDDVTVSGIGAAVIPMMIRCIIEIGILLQGIQMQVFRGAL